MSTKNSFQLDDVQGRLVAGFLQLILAFFFWLIFYIFYTSFRGEFLIVVKGMWILPLFLVLLTGGAVYTLILAIVTRKTGQEQKALFDRIGNWAGKTWYFGWALWNIVVGVPIAWVGKILILGALGSIPTALIVGLSLPFFATVVLLVVSGLGFLLSRFRRQQARLIPGTMEMGFAFMVVFGLFAIVAAAWHPQWADGVEHEVLFEPGDQPGRDYRIPSMIVLPGDTLLAFAESRVEGMSDLLDIDIVMRRSLDGGHTWSQIQIVRDQGKHTVHSPTPVYDADTGIVWLPFCVDYAALYIMSSADEGRTWSEPRNLSEEMGLGEDVWCHIGPGNGIQMTNGRLVIPGTLTEVTVIYSDDHGKTWKQGGNIASTEEPQVFERSDGALCANMRAGLNQSRIVSCSHDKGETWEPWRYNTHLPDADTQASIVRLTTQATHGKNRLLFSSPGVPYRGSMTVRLSYDEGETWPVSRLVYEGAAGYSQLAVLSDGTILLLFEAGRYDLRESIVLVRLNVDWLTYGNDSLTLR